MKRFVALLTAGVLLGSICGCNTKEKEDNKKEDIVQENQEEEITFEDKEIELTMWTYPVGEFQNSESVNAMLEKFYEHYPNIHITVECLDYKDGDARVSAAIEDGSYPDVILESPKRLVNDWGEKGLLVDLAELWDVEVRNDIAKTNTEIIKACKTEDGIFYEYPLCMTVHTMAINKELFERADAMKYLNEDRTWTTQDFENALRALKRYGVETPGIVYCGSVNGDQGTRALAENLYSADFTDEQHTEYTMNQEAGVKGLQQLVDWHQEGLISGDVSLTASEEILLFTKEETAMTFCWNMSNQEVYESKLDFTPYPVAFPSDDGIPELSGNIWGFGIFDKEDPDKEKASKLLIEFLCKDKEQGKESVQCAGFLPVRASGEPVYEGTDLFECAEEFMPFRKWMGDYYVVTENWSKQRRAWKELLQQIFSGEDLNTSLEVYMEAVNMEK